MRHLVIDCGCMTHREQESIAKLIERFDPDYLYGYDPMLSGYRTWLQGRTVVHTFAAAVWVEDGKVEMLAGQTPWEIASSTIVPEWRRGVKGEKKEVSCIDIRTLIEKLWTDSKEITLKLDVEGAEYYLLQRLIRTGMDKRVRRVLVEWHDVPNAEWAKHRILQTIHCEVEEWD